MVTDRELDEATVSWIGRDYGVEVGVPTGWTTPCWQVILHGPGGTYVTTTTDSLTHAWNQADYLARVMGGWPHARWEHGGTWWKAARAREELYKAAKADAERRGLRYFDVLAHAAETARYPNVHNAKWAAHRDT